MRGGVYFDVAAALSLSFFISSVADTNRGRNELFFILASSKINAVNIYYKDKFGSGSGSQNNFEIQLNK